MYNNSIKFDYGKFQFQPINSATNLNFIRPIAIGRFFLDNKPQLEDLNKEIYVYNLLQNNYLDFIQENEFDQIYCLGPYYPYKKWKSNNKKKSDWPNFSSILLNTKTKKMIDNSWHNRNGRIEQLRILSNFFGHFIKKANISLHGTIISVPAKPSYPFNSVEFISNEFSKVFSLPQKEILIRISDTNKEFYLKQDSETIPSEVILVDDLFTNGETKRKICELLRKNGANKIIIICLGKTDYYFYY
ncbi:MAG: hypothetical protein K9W44_04140 [Candidatus Lokiarchaeota archaeon]|nr:hypothetical protein [Candidatus Harpocratesius repetitus]